MQEILLTNQSFREIRNKGGLYIDKTKQIYDLFSWDKYFFLARPRRFGKSLLCSTLAELFTGNRELFKGTWIDSSNWQWEKYPVIHLDMGFAVSVTGEALDVRQKLTNILFETARAHDIVISNAPDPGEMLRQLIVNIKAKTNKQVVVIIDEYDKPLLDAIDKTDTFPSIHDEIRTFYSPLKLLDNELKHVFITGVFKFAKTSIFSGFNNLKDLTFSPKAGTVVGYTEQEIKTFFAQHLEALATKANVSVDAMMLTLQRQYNGYRFGLDTLTLQFTEGVYNSFGLNYVFQEKELLDKWFESGSPRAMVKKLAKDGFSGFASFELDIPFDTLNISCSPEGMTSLCTLYYAGYMTMHKCYVDNSGAEPITMIKLDFPSSQVRNAYAKHLLPALLHKSSDDVDWFASKIKRVFREQKLEKLQELLNDLLSTTTYEVFCRPNDKPSRENLYQIAFHCLFIVSNFRTVMEDTTNEGRADISVELPDVVYLFELKMDKPAADAMKQIKDTDYPRKFKLTGKKVYGIGISISTKNRKVTELEYEIL